MKCPEARGGTSKVAAVGSNWWSETEAEDRLDHSKWVFASGLAGGVFSCIGRGEARGADSDLFRRFACTYESAGPNVDKSGRLDIVTTGRDSFRVLEHTP